MLPQQKEMQSQLVSLMQTGMLSNVSWSCDYTCYEVTDEIIWYLPVIAIKIILAVCTLKALVSENS